MNEMTVVTNVSVQASRKELGWEECGYPVMTAVRDFLGDRILYENEECVVTRTEDDRVISYFQAKKDTAFKITLTGTKANQSFTLQIFDVDEEAGKMIPCSEQTEFLRANSAGIIEFGRTLKQGNGLVLSMCD